MNERMGTIGGHTVPNKNERMGTIGDHTVPNTVSREDGNYWGEGGHTVPNM